MHTGREMGLLAGANIIMPNITDVQYRNLYQLYDGDTNWLSYDKLMMIYSFYLNERRHANVLKPSRAS